MSILLIWWLSDKTHIKYRLLSQQDPCMCPSSTLTRPSQDGYLILHTNTITLPTFVTERTSVWWQNHPRCGSVQLSLYFPFTVCLLDVYGGVSLITEGRAVLVKREAAMEELEIKRRSPDLVDDDVVVDCKDETILLVGSTFGYHHYWLWAWYWYYWPFENFSCLQVLSGKSSPSLSILFKLEEITWDDTDYTWWKFWPSRTKESIRIILETRSMPFPSIHPGHLCVLSAAVNLTFKKRWKPGWQLWGGGCTQACSGRYCQKEE